MIDIRSKYILKYLVAECADGSYKVIEIIDLINAIPDKFKIDEKSIELSMDYLEKSNYISIKYKDEKMYCVVPLPSARELLETESNEKQKTKKIIRVGFMIYVLVFVFAFLGSFMAILVYGLIIK